MKKCMMVSIFYCGVVLGAGQRQVAKAVKYTDPNSMNSEDLSITSPLGFDPKSASWARSNVGSAITPMPTKATPESEKPKEESRTKSTEQLTPSLVDLMPDDEEARFEHGSMLDKSDYLDKYKRHLNSYLEESMAPGQRVVIEKEAHDQHILSTLADKLFMHTENFNKYLVVEGNCDRAQTFIQDWIFNNDNGLSKIEKNTFERIFKFLNQQNGAGVNIVKQAIEAISQGRTCAKKP